MRKIVECIPNFSEGRDANVVDQIISAITSVPGVYLLDREMDASHNRCVITFAGEPASVAKAAVSGTGKASELIDLRKHKGEHPRIGATDVLPFVPISGITMQECVKLAEQVGQAIAERYKIPVYLYEEAARTPERRDLPYLRKGEFEGLRQEIETDPQRRPDFGEPRIHPSAGATIVGARFPLIAYNVYLNTNRLEVAKNIAKAVRHSSGGLRYIRALGFDIKERNQVQVSINLTNYEGTPIFRVFELVRREAERYGVAITSSEIVGLIPQKALNQCADFYLQLERFDESQILENRLESALAQQKGDVRLRDFVEGVAASDATPGGGSVAALSGALAAALGKMVCSLTLGKKKHAGVEAEVLEISQQMEAIKNRLYALIEEDSQAYERVVAAYGLPKNNEQEVSHRNSKVEESLKRATEVPLDTAEAALEALKLLRKLQPICNRNVLSDLGVGALMGQAAVKGAAYNAYINLSSLKDERFRRASEERIASALGHAQHLSEEIEKSIRFL